MRKAMRRLVIALLVIVMVLSVTVIASADNLYYEPDYAKTSAKNSELMNSYFMEFCDLEWYKTTDTEVINYLKDNKIPYEVEKEDGYISSIEIGKIDDENYETELYEIRTDYKNITVNHLSLTFTHDSGENVLEGALISTPDSPSKVKSYYQHFYDVTVDAEDSDSLISLSGDFFNIMIIGNEPKDKDDSAITFVMYMVVPDTIYLN